jgi:hypothetical protein
MRKSDACATLRIDLQHFRTNCTMPRTSELRELEGLMNIAAGILMDIVHFIRLVVFAVLDVLGTVIRPALAGLGHIGFLMCGFYALVAPNSHFPHGQMLAIAGGFIGLLVVYDLITYAIKPKATSDD